MTGLKGSSRAALRVASATFVVGVTVAIVALTLAQRGGSLDPWVELSRYLPYYWLLLPCLAAFAAACWLGRAWAVASLAAPLVLATATMSAQWNLGEAGEQRIRLMTYNSKLNRVDDPAVVQAVGREVARHDPDVLVMQDSDGLLVARSAPPLVARQPLFGLPYVYGVSQYVVASRLPMRGCAPGGIDYGGESHRYLRCTFDAHGTELTVVTMHFKSPRMGLLAARREGVDGADEWQSNFAERLAQSRELALQLAPLPRPLVVAGDLNAPESSPVIRQLLAAGLRDSFSVSGRGYGFSYGQSMRAGLSFLRIDHILASPDVGFAASFVGGGRTSDHRPVIADLLLRR